METIDLTAEIEAAQPKPKARSRAKAKAQPPDETLPPPEPKPKAKAKAKAKSKAKDVVVVDEEPTAEIAAPSEPIVIADEQPASTEPIVIADEQPAVNSFPSGEKNEPPTVVESQPTVEEPSVVEAATTTRKPKGHRAKDPNKVPLTKKVACKKCDKTVSLHSAKYTHDKFCKNKSEGEPSNEIPSKPLRVTLSASSSSSSSQPLTLRDKLNAKRVESAKKLVSLMF